MISSSSDEEKNDKKSPRQQQRANDSTQKEVDIYAASELRDDDDDIDYSLFKTPNNQVGDQTNIENKKHSSELKHIHEEDNKNSNACSNKTSSNDGTLDNCKPSTGKNLNDNRNSRVKNV
jgi:hypothetical protein